MAKPNSNPGPSSVAVQQKLPVSSSKPVPNSVWNEAEQEELVVDGWRRFAQAGVEARQNYTPKMKLIVEQFKKEPGMTLERAAAEANVPLEEVKRWRNSSYHFGEDTKTR